jgi:phosphate transport system protein
MAIRMHRHFEDELEKLRTLLIRMGSLVDEQIELAIKSIFESNVELAKLVQDRERRVNEFDLMVEGQCQRIFALSQPVAVDLRLMMAAMRINADLERIGDIAVNLSERVEPLEGYQEFLERVGAKVMIAAARQMLSDAFDAFINNDPQLARSVFGRDDIVDDLTRDTFYACIEEMKKDPLLIEPGSHLMALLRHVERLADHATNIAEDVIFIVEAVLLKHNSGAEAAFLGAAFPVDDSGK